MFTVPLLLFSDKIYCGLVFPLYLYSSAFKTAGIVIRFSIESQKHTVTRIHDQMIVKQF